MDGWLFNRESLMKLAVFSCVQGALFGVDCCTWTTTVFKRMTKLLTRLSVAVRYHLTVSLCLFYDSPLPLIVVVVVVELIDDKEDDDVLSVDYRKGFSMNKVKHRNTATVLCMKSGTCFSVGKQQSRQML